MKLLGVDPGFTGALAVLDTELGTLEIIDMPTRDIPNSQAKIKREVDGKAIASWLADKHVELAAVERVASRSQQGVASMFAFGAATDRVVGVCEGLGIPVVRPKPKDWQRKVKLKGGDDIKDHSRDKAVLLYPAYAAYFGRKSDHGRSDATLIAHSLTL